MNIACRSRKMTTRKAYPVQKFRVLKHRLEELLSVRDCVNFAHAQSFADY